MSINLHDQNKFTDIFVSRIDEIQLLVQADIDKNRQFWMDQITGRHHTSESKEIVASKPFVSYPGKPTVEIDETQTFVTFHTPVLSFFNDRYSEAWHQSEESNKPYSSSSEGYTASYAVWYSLKYDNAKDEFSIDTKNTRPLYNVGYDKPGHTYLGKYVGVEN